MEMQNALVLRSTRDDVATWHRAPALACLPRAAARAGAAGSRRTDLACDGAVDRGHAAVGAAHVDAEPVLDAARVEKVAARQRLDALVLFELGQTDRALVVLGPLRAAAASAGLWNTTLESASRSASSWWGERGDQAAVTTASC